MPLPYNAAMPRGGIFDVSFPILSSLAVLVAVHFVAVRTASSLVFPIVAGWLVTRYFHE